ncbi:MAG: hypothetical protein HQ519_19480 [Planctomycetes bacterium]|nr:hypothetical protein [Planctomycetota bacterium]
MVFFAGVDEAGYGPFVGPFSVGYSLFRVPALEIDFWQELSNSVTRKPIRNDRRLRVDDSKKVHSGPHGRTRLERSVAAFRELIQPHQSDFQSWAKCSPAGPSIWFDRSPWLKDLNVPFCPSVSAERVQLDVLTLQRSLHASGLSLDDFGARIVPAGEWNQWIQKTQNKGETLFQLSMEVVRHLLSRTGHSPLRIELDRHGGRLHYAPKLQTALQPQKIVRHGETLGGSTYTLQYPNREVQIRFSEKADATFLPVSLASLAAKQSRERSMDLFNDWWAHAVPELVGTKGYGVDGKRWLAEVEGHIPAGVPKSILRRNR